MALTLAQLKKLVEAEGLKYFVHPEQQALLLTFRGLYATYQVVIVLDVEGTFLQFRTLDCLRCSQDNPHLLEVLKVLGAINYRTRLVKFAWDAGDGEIVAFADMWLQDAGLTQSQLGRMLGNFLPVVDLGYGRIEVTLTTGKDPGEAGEQELQELIEELRKHKEPSLLRRLVERLTPKPPKPGEEGPPDITEI